MHSKCIKSVSLGCYPNETQMFLGKCWFLFWCYPLTGTAYKVWGWNRFDSVGKLIRKICQSEVWGIRWPFDLLV